MRRRPAVQGPEFEAEPEPGRREARGEGDEADHQIVARPHRLGAQRHVRLGAARHVPRHRHIGIGDRVRRPHRVRGVVGIEGDGERIGAVPADAHRRGEPPDAGILGGGRGTRQAERRDDPRTGGGGHEAAGQRFGAAVVEGARGDAQEFGGLDELGGGGDLSVAQGDVGGGIGDGDAGDGAGLGRQRPAREEGGDGDAGGDETPAGAPRDGAAPGDRLPAHELRREGEIDHADATPHCLGRAVWTGTVSARLTAERIGTLSDRRLAKGCGNTNGAALPTAPLEIPLASDAAASGRPYFADRRPDGRRAVDDLTDEAEIGAPGRRLLA